MSATSPAGRRRRRRERGFILVAVLWILAAVATLAGVYSVYVGDAAFATHLNDDRVRIRAATLAAVELAAYRLTAVPPTARSSQGRFALALRRASVEARFVSEGARIDLNAAPKAMLAGLFGAIGASAAQAATLADRVVGWRRKGDAAGQNDEAAAYAAAGYAYAPRQAPFRNTLEMSLLLGLPPHLVARALPLVTVFSGRGEIDVRVAPPEVLAALPGMSAELLKKILDQRAQAPEDAESLLEMLGPGRVDATAAPGDAARVTIDVRLDNGRRARAEVVILVQDGDDEPFRVLSWRDGADGIL